MKLSENQRLETVQYGTANKRSDTVRLRYGHGTARNGAVPVRWSMGPHGSMTDGGGNGSKSAAVDSDKRQSPKRHNSTGPYLRRSVRKGHNSARAKTFYPTVDKERNDGIAKNRTNAVSVARQRAESGTRNAKSETD